MGELHHQQSCIDLSLRYSASFHCELCDAAYALDGHEAPEEIRALLLLERGRWKLELLDAGKRRLHLIRSLSKELDRTLAEALELVRELPCVLADGTEVEMRCLAARLQRFGAELSVSQSDSS
jgi:hypothetical protein